MKSSSLNAITLQGCIVRCCGRWLMPDKQNWTTKRESAGVFDSATVAQLEPELAKQGKFVTTQAL